MPTADLHPLRWRRLGAGLALVTFLVFLPVARNGFVGPYDDDRAIVANPMVSDGLSRAGAAWACTTFAMGNWHPLTWLSHQLDVSLFGMAPAAHHLESAAIHAASAGVLFLALRALTGALWPSLLAASLFAVHPLRVESVAWAAERKDVLAGLFWSLALLGYARFVRAPSRARYLAVLGSFVLGLLSKPSVVTLPLVLLIVDAWPLGRLRAGAARRVLLEKVPFLALAAGVSVVTLFAQRDAGTLGLNRILGPGERLAGAVTSCVGYLAKGLWPAGLAIYYPRPLETPWRDAAAAALLLAAITAVAVRLRRRRPWLLAGWAWFVAALLPMIGVVQAGAQAMADRYTYLTLTGVCVALAWEARALVRRRPSLAPPAAAAAVAAFVALAALTQCQIGHWRDAVTVSRRALAVTRDNWFVANNLGASLLDRGESAEAIAQFRAVLKVRPDDVFALSNIGTALFRTGRPGEALVWVSRARDLAPENLAIRRNFEAVRAAALGDRTRRQRPRPAPERPPPARGDGAGEPSQVGTERRSP